MDKSIAGRMTRRSILAGAALFGVGVGTDRLLSERGQADKSGPPPAVHPELVAFQGVHQAGIATAAPEFLNFAAFDLAVDSLDSVRSLMASWTAAARQLTLGQKVEREDQETGASPVDTGEAVGLGPRSLTLTFGFGRSLFLKDGKDRLGIADLLPSAMDPLPTFRGEDLQRDISDGDICVQACASDAQVAFHAIHVLTRLAEGTAILRWGQQGFGRTSSTSQAQPTPRNLMGFKDGTANIRSEDEKAMNRFVWVAPGDGPAWMTGGSYLVARRIEILFDVWDATTLEGQERVIGRTKASGAPLGERHEYDPIDLAARYNGVPAIPDDAHIRLASPEYNQRERLLRRGYSYSEAPEPNSGQIDAGLFFICFQRDPRRQFVPIQHRLAAADALNRHTLHTASALFACPAGVGSQGFIGEAMFV